jgi:hypothetical protein
MIPSLVSEGFTWVIVDNIHFDRGSAGYPWKPGSSMLPPNRADQRNLTPAHWVERRDMWAPTPTSAPFGYQPHYVAYVHPDTAKESRIIAVPAAHYEGNEDGRGGFGALNYEKVLSQLRPYNTDPQHPMLVVLHHDGDNHGGGTDGYYGNNFQNFVNWISQNPAFEWTTIQDYLQRFPPKSSDLIHIEDGGWSGSGGDPLFSKWNAALDAKGYSSDRNSWAVLIAAENRVRTAEALAPAGQAAQILAGKGNATNRAWRHLLEGQTSCYEYWDGQEPWDSHPTRAANLAGDLAETIITTRGGKDTVGPSLFPPQRTPYNPGELEWANTSQPTDVDIWTLADDLSGVAEVTLKYRAHAEPVSPAHRLYRGGSWISRPMIAKAMPAPKTTIVPRYRAQEFRATIQGLRQTFVDYYIEAMDNQKNVSRSAIQHVWVGGLKRQ